MKSLFHLLIACTCALAVPAFADLDVPRHIPTQTAMVVRLDVDQVRASQLATALLAAHDGRIQNLQNGILQFTGLDIDSISQAWMLAPEKDKGVVVLKGNFSAEQLRGRFGKLPNVSVEARTDALFAGSFVDEKKPDEQYAALIDARTLVVGDKENALIFLEALGDADARFPADHAQIRRLAQSDAPIIATILGGPQRWNDFDHNMTFAVDEVWLSGDIGEDVTLKLSVVTKQAVQAEALAKLGAGLCQFKATDPTLAGNPLILAVLNSAKTDAIGNTATMTVRLTGSVLQEQLANRR